ncbi:MAG TPA: O-antigen ligase family protein [Chloroflexia bacterium]|nr:O-antigen ligase family protein [Chloroflexia bacterium]
MSITSPPAFPGSKVSLPDSTAMSGGSSAESNPLLILAGLALVPAFLLPGWWCWPALGLFGLWLGVNARVSGRLWRRTALDWPVILVLAGMLVGLLSSLDPALSANRAWSLVGGLVAFSVVSNGCSPRQVRAYGGLVLSVLGAAVSLLSLIAVDWGRGDLLKLPVIYDHLPHLLNGSFGSGASAESEINPRVVAGALAMLVPAAWTTFFSFSRANLRHKRLKLAGLLLMNLFTSLTLLLTQAPTAIAGLIVAGFLVFLVWSLSLVNGRRRVAAAGLLGLLLALFGLVLLMLLPRLAALLPASDAEPTRRIVFRLEMWLRALDMFAAKPFTGIGLNNFPVSLSHFYPTYSLGPEAHAHNLVLQTALDGGVIGLAAFICVLVGVFSLLRQAWRERDSARRWLIAGVAVGTLAWLFYGVGESITLAHKPAVILWMMWGLVAALAYQPRKEAAQPDDAAVAPGWWKRQRYPLAGLALSLLCLGGLLIAGGWDMFQTNLAVLEAQKALLDNGNGGNFDAAAGGRLAERLVQKGFPGAATFDLAAHLAARQGDFDATADYLQREARLDARNTVLRYIPGEWNIWRPLKDSPPGQPILRLYNQWKMRYPTDPLGYARLAVAYRERCQAGQAATVLQEGLKLVKPDDALLLKALLLQKEVPPGC